MENGKIYTKHKKQNPFYLNWALHKQICINRTLYKQIRTLYKQISKDIASNTTTEILVSFYKFWPWNKLKEADVFRVIRSKGEVSGILECCGK